MKQVPKSLCGAAFLQTGRACGEWCVLRSEDGESNKPNYAPSVRTPSIDTRAPAPYSLPPHAQMAELVDAPASGAGVRKDVEVRVLFWAPYKANLLDFLVILGWHEASVAT